MDDRSPRSRKLRKGRCSLIGGFYFLTTSVAARRRIFVENRRAEIVLDAIRWLHDSERFHVDAGVVMPDHVHVVGQLRAGTLSGVMHSLKRFTANRRSRAGVSLPVWQGGFHDHGLRCDEDYRTRVRYVLENPIRAGLAECVDDYPHLILPDWWMDPDD